MEKQKFRNLQIWKRSVAFVTYIYILTKDYPKEEIYGLVDQIHRAAVSIALNIAEGSGSGSDPEFNRFLKMAKRSCYEVITGLEIAINLKMGSVEKNNTAIDEADELSAMISGFIKKLKADS